MMCRWVKRVYTFLNCEFNYDGVVIKITSLVPQCEFFILGTELDGGVDVH